MRLPKCRARHAVLAGALVACLVPAAQADPIVFFGEDLSPGGVVVAGGAADSARNLFLSSLIGVGTESFEGFAAAAPAPFNLSFPGSSGAIGATLSGGGAFICDETDNCLPPAAGEFPTSGVRWVATDETLTVTFSDPVAAFGFFGTDIGDVGASLILTLTDTDGNTDVLNVPHSLGGISSDFNVLYFGFIDPANTYTSVEFGLVGGTGDFFGFDDMTIGDLEQVRIPEPTALSLVGLSLAALGWAHRRRKRSQA